MIPARMGSQRLTKKNLQKIKGTTLISHAIRKCVKAGCFDEIWVNSEHPDFGEIAQSEGVHFHQRPASLGNSVATSEQYVAEFLEKNRCDTLFQVHSIAPLLTAEDVVKFVKKMESSSFDTLLSCDNIQIECVYGSKPVNFNFDEKSNSQDLEPIQRVNWAISAWKRGQFLEAFRSGKCATYSGDVGFHSLSTLTSHIIKTKEDLLLAEKLFDLVFSE
ncbi:NTP transferase domain-containing protein [Puniceicoccaceae bacterium K14]|nr:NTP transferase domain-containing protein [Puniceicoccaceae bacterium K14]